MLLVESTVPYSSVIRHLTSRGLYCRGVLTVVQYCTVLYLHERARFMNSGTQKSRSRLV